MTQSGWFGRKGWVSLTVLAMASACSAAGGGPEEVDLGGGGGGAGEGSGGSSGDGQAEPLPLEPGGDPTLLCGQSEAGPPALRRLNRRELERSIRDILPVVGSDWRSALSADTVSEAGFDNDAGMLLVSKQTARELAETAESVGTAVAGNLAQVLPCAASTPDQSCAGQFLDSVGRRLFRRPLTEAERTSYLGFFDTALGATGDFAQSIGWLTRGLIESPSFVYRREIGTVSGDVAQLDQYEIATELAYTFSGTAPSQELLDAASRGELSSPDRLIQAARDLLLSPAGREVVQTFFDSYVGHSRVTSIAKAEVPEFASMREHMLNETRRFIEEVVINRGGGARELLTATFTTPSTQLAGFYRYGTGPASDYAVVERPPEYGIGLLAQGSVLATLAQPNGSSPTKRGLWVYERLLCNEVPMVPPNIPELGAPEPGARTTRQRYEEDHAQGSCQNCHSRWDPIGFGFEHFDEAGRYRATEGPDPAVDPDPAKQLPIDAQSYVPEQVDFSRRPDPENPLFRFNGQEELMTQLAEQPQVHQCMSAYVTTFAFGGALTCAGETEREAFMAGEIGFIDYLASLAGEPHFTQRSLD